MNTTIQTSLHSLRQCCTVRTISRTLLMIAGVIFTTCVLNTNPKMTSSLTTWISNPLTHKSALPVNSTEFTGPSWYYFGHGGTLTSRGRTLYAPPRNKYVGPVLNIKTLRATKKSVEQYVTSWYNSFIGYNYAGMLWGHIIGPMPWVPYPTDQVRDVGWLESLKYGLWDRQIESATQLFETEIETNTRLRLRCQAELVDHYGWMHYAAHPSQSLTVLCILRERAGLGRRPPLSLAGLYYTYSPVSFTALVVITCLISMPTTLIALYRTAWKHSVYKRKLAVVQKKAMPLPARVCVPTPPMDKRGENMRISKAVGRHYSAWIGQVDQVLSPENLCSNCAAGRCMQHTGSVAVFPGVTISHLGLEKIATRPNVFLSSTKRITHANCVQDGGKTSTRIPRTLVTDNRVIKREDVEYGGGEAPITVFRIFQSPEPTPLPRKTYELTVDGKVFCISGKRVSMIWPVLETVPADIISGITTRLTTDEGSIASLHDHVRSFLASKLIANNIKLTHMQSWVLLICDLTNKHSVVASSALTSNLPVDASCFTRMRYCVQRAVGKWNPLSASPSRTEYEFPEVHVPSYEVFSTQKNVTQGTDFKPEGPNPFQDVRPLTDASVVGESQRSASEDGHECTDVHGDESTGAAADPQPTDNRTNADAGGDLILPRTTTAQHMPEVADVRAEGPGVGADVINRPSNNKDRESVPDSGTDSVADPLAASFGEASVYCMPYTRTDSSGQIVQRWNLTLEGGIYSEPLPLIGCFECVQRVGKTAISRKKDPVSYLADAFSKPNVRSCCTANAAGVRSARACKLASSGLSEQDVLTQRRKRLTANILSEVGRSVPDEPEANVNRSIPARGGTRRVGLQRRDRKVLPKNGNKYKGNRPSKHLTEVGQFPIGHWSPN